jgi:hypothetical protein
MPVSIDSNASSAYYNEEVALKVAGTGPFYPLEPNSYTNFGGDLKTVAREPITNTRQRNKGTVTDLDVTAGWNEDFTQNNITRLIQGFLFAAARQKATTFGFTFTVADAISVTVTGFHTTGVSFITRGFKVGHIIKSSNFATPSNNFNYVITAVTATDIACAPVDNLASYNQAGVAEHETGVLVAEATGAGGIIEAVGFQLANTATMAGVDGSAGQMTLNAPAGVDFTTFGFVPNEIIYIGDVNGTNAPNYNFIDSVTATLIYRGYARIATIAAGKLTFDVTVMEGFGSGAATAVATNKANIYFGTVIKNESDPTLIIRKTYTLLRTLGNDVSNEAIYETILGAVPNQFVMNIPSNNKLAVDMDFIGMDNQPGVGLPVGATLGVPLNEEPYNTSSDVVVMLLYIINNINPEQVPLFGYATDEKLTINNNVKANKAIGVIGGFEASVGMFDVSGTLTCYFDDERAIQAVRQNADVGLLNLFAKKRQGMAWDLPLLTLGGGLLKVEKDKPIMTDITHTAAAGTNNLTVLYNKFEFLPDAAMSEYVPVNF